MNNSTICDIDLNADQIFLPVLYGCVFCIGLPTNCLALYGMFCLVKTDYTLPIYIINLLLADLLQIGTLPLWMDYYSRGHQWRFGHAACKIIGCVFYISLFVSICFMCCVSLERYLAIVHPLWFQSQRMVRNVYLLSLAVWLFFTSAVAVGFKMGFEGNTTSTLCMEEFPSKTDFALFQLVSIPFTFLLPLLFLLFVFFRVRSSLARSVSLSGQEKRRFNGLLLLIVLMFLLIFGPYHLVRMVRYAGVISVSDKCHFESRIFLPFQIALGLLSVNAILDPIMYIFIYKSSREKMLASFPCLHRMGRSREIGVTP
ncbi:G-protein coupled receptor 4-like [Amia ocellicauda]|uniref:G-protein coupled receptor 4-like n=1 Tax=Amia ocellicauda TaxID=2972642 RepID=UPI0034640165